MLNHLKDKKDVGFFTSIAGLMNSCSVLDLDAFERNTKAEGTQILFITRYIMGNLRPNQSQKNYYIIRCISWPIRRGFWALVEIVALLVLGPPYPDPDR